MQDVTINQVLKQPEITVNKPCYLVEINKSKTCYLTINIPDIKDHYVSFKGYEISFDKDIRTKYQSLLDGLNKSNIVEKYISWQFVKEITNLNYRAK